MRLFNLNRPIPEAAPCACRGFIVWLRQGSLS